MTPATRRLLVALLAAASWQAGIGAQARERVAFVSVVDRETGAPAATVTAADLVVREDKIAREILRITPATGPMPIAVLLDNSAAAEPAIQDLRSGLAGFVAALGDLGPVTFVTMGERPTIVTDYTPSADLLRAGIGKIFSRPASGATALEAVWEVTRGLQRREAERAAIVLVGLAGAEQSTLDADAVLGRLKDSGASLHVIALAVPGRGRLDDATRERDTLFDRGSRQSGGRYRTILSSQAIAPALADVATILTHQHRVVYARPQTLIPPDTFEVAATRPGLIAYGTAARGQPK